MAKVNVKILSEFIHQKLESSLGEEVGPYHETYHTAWQSAHKKLDLLDGKKDGLVDESQADQIVPTIVSSWKGVAVSSNRDGLDGKQIPGLIGKIAQGEGFKKRIQSLFAPTNEALWDRYRLGQPTEVNKSPGGPERNFNSYSPPSANPIIIDLKTLKSEWSRLSTTKKMDFLASIRARPIHLVQHGNPKNKFNTLPLIEFLFPQLKALVQSQKNPGDVIKALLAKLSSITQSQPQSKKKLEEIQLEVMATMIYLGDHYEKFIWKIGNKTSREMESSLKRLYNPTFFDTDGDGRVDKEDPFPSYTYYREDANQNQIPDELEQVGLDPDHFFGLAEGQMVSNVKGSSIKGNLNLLRFKDQVYLVINLRLGPRKPKDYPYVPKNRDQWKREAEATFREINRSHPLAPQVRINFYAEDGVEIETSEDHIQPSIYWWNPNMKNNTLVHELGHHLGLFDRYSRNNFRLEFDLLFNPGLYTLWDRPHLMNKNDLVLDPVDWAAVAESIVLDNKTLEEPNLAIADIFLEQGEYDQAEAIYLKFFNQFKTNEGDYFKDKHFRYNGFWFENDDYQGNGFIHKQLIALAGFKGLIRSKIYRYHQDPDPPLLQDIEKRLVWLEKLSRDKQDESVEARWVYGETKQLREFLKTGIDYSMINPPDVEAPGPEDTGERKSPPPNENQPPRYRLGLYPLWGYRFFSRGTGEKGTFDKKGNRVDDALARGEMIEDTHQEEIMENGEEMASGAQLQFALPTSDGWAEIIGQASLIRYQNFAEEKNHTEISTMLGFNMVFRGNDAAIRPYIGWRIESFYNVESETFGAGASPAIPSVLGLRIKLRDHFQLDAQAAAHLQFIPQQRGTQNENSVRPQIALGAIYLIQ